MLYSCTHMETVGLKTMMMCTFRNQSCVEMIHPFITLRGNSNKSRAVRASHRIGLHSLVYI